MFILIAVYYYLYLQKKKLLRANWFFPDNYFFNFGYFKLIQYFLTFQNRELEYDVCRLPQTSILNLHCNTAKTEVGGSWV